MAAARLKIEDLQKVKNELWEARTQWKDFGLELSMSQNTLDSIGITQHNDPGNCFREMLADWLRGGGDPPRTWSTIVTALKRVKPLEAIAEDVGKNHGLASTGSSGSNSATAAQSQAVDVQAEVQTQSMTFNSSMSDEDFFKWLKSKGIGDKDCKTLSENGVNPSAITQLDAEDFDNIGLTKLGKKLFLKAFTETKGQHASEALATPTKPQNPPTSPAAATKLEVLPTQKQLLKFKYTDRGEKKNLEIISGASHKWRDIASLLSDDPNVADKVEKKHPGDVNECLKLVFTDYFIRKKPEDYSHDWNGVIEVLEDVGLQTLADKVKKAVPLGGKSD